MSDSIPFSSILEGDRARNSKKYGDLSGLIGSLESIGSIAPIVLSKRPASESEKTRADVNGFVYDLVAGGRRYAAMTQMKVAELHHGSVLTPGKLGFLFRSEVPEHELREAELDENLHRLDMDWIDNVLLIERVHTLKKASTRKWGYRQTAELLGPGYGLTNVTYALNIAKFLRNGDKEFLACSRMNEAISLLVKRQEDLALAEATKRNMARVQATPQTGAIGASFLDTLSGSILAPKQAAKEMSNRFANAEALLNPKPVEAVTSTQPTVITEPVVVPLSTLFRLGNSLTEVMPSYPDSFFDHIVTDIPYGIDMDNLTVKGKADVEAQHEVESNLTDMPVFLTQAYRLVRSGGFCVFFMDAEHFTYLLNLAKEIGWKTQDWMLIWVKTHPCRNGGAAYNFTKTYETAMVLRKDEKTVLRKHGPNSVWIGDGAAERKMYNNPFAKPFLLWKELILDNIAFPGQKIYDPYGGELSSSRAVANCGMIPYASEISTTHLARGVEHMKAVYSLIHASNVKFV